MKLGKVLIAAALVAFGFGTSARAANTLGLETVTTGTDTGDITTATVFSFDTSPIYGPNVLISDGTSGIFTAIPTGSAIGTTNLDLSATPLITLTYGVYTFSGDTLTLDDIAPDGKSRTIELKGHIHGLSGGRTLAATYTLGFTQDGGPGSAVSFSGTLAAVPEPASVAMLAMGGLGLGVVALRRRVASRA